MSVTWPRELSVDAKAPTVEETIHNNRENAHLLRIADMCSAVTFPVIVTRGDSALSVHEGRNTASKRLHATASKPSHKKSFMKK